MKEEWKQIEGFENLYMISNKGYVKSLISNKILKNLCGSTGYYHVSLYKDKKQTIKSIHRLLAIAFIPNPLSKPVINHIDSDRKNNRLDNLEWCTQKENLQHARDSGRLNHDSQKKKVKSFNPRTNEVTIYDSVNSVKKFGFTPGLVCYCAKNIIKSKTHKGLVWDYV